MLILLILHLIQVGYTALAAACAEGHAATATLLVENGANVNALSSQGSPLAIAVEQNHALIQSMLVANGAYNIPAPLDLALAVPEAAENLPELPVETDVALPETDDDLGVVPQVVPQVVTEDSADGANQGIGVGDLSFHSDFFRDVLAGLLCMYVVWLAVLAFLKHHVGRYTQHSSNHADVLVWLGSECLVADPARAVGYFRDAADLGSEEGRWLYHMFSLRYGFRGVGNRLDELVDVIFQPVLHAPRTRVQESREERSVGRPHHRH